MTRTLLDVPCDAVRYLLDFLSGQSRHALRATCRHMYGLRVATGCALRVAVTNPDALALCRTRLANNGADAHACLPFWGRHARRVVLVFGSGNADARKFCQVLARLCGGAFSEAELRLVITETWCPFKTMLDLANWLPSPDGWPKAKIFLTGLSKILPLRDITPGLAARLADAVHVFYDGPLQQALDFPTFPVLRSLCVDRWAKAMDVGRHIRDLFPAVRAVRATLNAQEPCIQDALQRLSAGLETAHLRPGNLPLGEPISIGPDTEVVLKGFAYQKVVTGGRIVESVIYEPALASHTDGLYEAKQITLSLNKVSGMPSRALPNCVRLTAISDQPLPSGLTEPADSERPVPPVRDSAIDAAFDDLLQRAPVLRSLHIDPCTVDVCRLSRFPASLRLVDLTNFPGALGCPPMPLVLAAMQHLFTTLSARCGSGHPRSIVAPWRTKHSGCRAYCQAIADLRWAAKPDGDAPRKGTPPRCGCP